MCLYTDQKVPEDLTGVTGYKSYCVVDGSLVTPYMGYHVNKMTQMAAPQDHGAEQIKVNQEMIERLMLEQLDLLYLGPGYIHAVLNRKLGVMMANKIAAQNVILVKGRFVGLGYKSTLSNDACAEGFELEEIVYEKGDK